MPLNFEQTLEFVAFLVAVASNVAVAGVTCRAWRYHWLPFLAFLAAGGLLGILTTVASRLYNRPGVSEDHYY
ncbi:MAG: hypothetical protein ACR2OZ_05175 [Verrucomicrobiales bacterium]